MPGFGFILALVALIAAMLLVFKREPSKDSRTNTNSEKQPSQNQRIPKE